MKAIVGIVYLASLTGVAYGLEHLGCYGDSNEKRTLSGKTTRMFTTNSPKACGEFCAGYSYAGMEYADECFCDNTRPSNKLPADKCYKGCPGEPSKKCGGDWAMNVYKLPGNAAPPVTRVGAKKVVCYLGSWSVGRSDGFNINSIDPTLCTHLIYAFVGTTAQGVIRIMNENADINNGGYQKFVGLKTRNPNAKMLLAIGGGDNNIGNSNTFSQTNFNQLLRELRVKFDTRSPPFLLTAAVNPTAYNSRISYDIPVLAKTLDFINIMTYDFHGSWSKETGTGSNAPLYSSDELNVDTSINYWLSQGAPASKLVLGMGTYGHTFTLTDPNNHGIGAPFSSSGSLMYNEICAKIQAGGWIEVWEDREKVPYAYNGNLWVGYDNVRSIQIKTQYIKTKGLAGGMIWSLEQDDFDGRCKGPRFPLLRVVHDAMQLTNLLSRMDRFHFQKSLL